jgi:transposase
VLRRVIGSEAIEGIARRQHRHVPRQRLRHLQRLGHEVLLMPPQYVKPYAPRGKNDAIDAAAICEAMSRPTMRFVPVKTAEQQAALTMLGVRDLLVKQRTMLINAIRGHAAEFGVTAAKEPALAKAGDHSRSSS